MGRGKWSGTVGVLLLLAALVLTVHNLREARQAEHFSGETAAKLTEEISRRRTARSGAGAAKRSTAGGGSREH